MTTKRDLLTLWDLTGAAPRQLAWLPGRGGRLYAVAFDRSGSLVATGADDGTLEVSGVDALGGRTLALRHQKGPVNDVSFSPDGKWLAAASDDGVLRLWDFAIDDAIVLRLDELVRERVPWRRTDSAVTPLLPAAP